MIRAATPDDLPALLELGQAMHCESPEYRDMRFCPNTLRHTLTLAMDQHFLRVAEQPGGRIVGGLAAMAVPHWFGPDRLACDLGIFVAPEARGGMAAARLVRAYVKWARELGAKKITLGITTGVDVETTARLCERLGARRSGIIMEFA